jgi:hypothetical protein
MSITKNLNGQAVPVREARSSFGVLAAVNAELVHDVNGDESALVHLVGTGTLNATYNIQGSPDGTNYYDLLAYPMSNMCIGGTIPPAGQPLLTEAVNVATVHRALAVACGGLKKIRVRLTAYTSGNCDATINSDSQASINPFVAAQRSATLMITATGAVSAAVTATLPAVAGLRHYVDFIKVTRSATAPLTASATPTVVTTTNIPGTPAVTFGLDVSAIGLDKEYVLDFGSSGLAATAINTATTVVCPVLTGAIWRINVAYRLGL